MNTKVFFILSFVIIAFSSCSGDDDNSRSEMNIVLGQWKLIEQLADPGDGSGTFRTIESKKVLEFSEDGIITVYDGSLCQPYSEQQISKGTYSLSTQGITTNCDNVNISFISFEMKEGFLILNFASNEGFSQKFKRLNVK
ncbi:lipocalin family protein [Flavimarina sp. Hel_I_48]|uniref:lipocalin family protein n=1 Tax=Flavimarina sp. Hel_I_48 TaxID=1392488 RepID=UPI0004DED9EF|nr:lipocalin family protein [Flavimarina sp. Hel_I_48]